METQVGGKELAVTLQKLLILNPISVEDSSEVEHQIDLLLGAEQSHEDDTALIQAVWRQTRVLELCQDVLGLRSTIRNRACGGVLPAISDLLARAVRGREREAACVVIHAGYLLIPEHIFGAFVHLLEINRYGAGPGFLGDEEVEDLVHHPEGPSGLWRRWITWAGGTVQNMAWVSCARWPGAFSCVGIPVRDNEKIASIVDAARQIPPPWPVVVLSQPLLWSWPIVASRDFSDLVARFRSPAERQVFANVGNISDLRRALDTDPVTAWSAITAYWAPGDTRIALVRLMRQIIAMAACMSAQPANPQGIVSVCLTAEGCELATIRVFRSGSRLVVNANGLAAAATWIGLAPWRFPMFFGEPCSWDWASIAHCGWSELVQDGMLEPVRVQSSDDLWFALPAGGVPLAMPEATLGWTAANEESSVSLPSPQIRLDSPWTPPETD